MTISTVFNTMDPKAISSVARDIDSEVELRDTVKNDFSIVVAAITEAFAEDMEEPMNAFNEYIYDFHTTLCHERLRIDALIRTGDEQELCSLMAQIQIVNVIVMNEAFESYKYYAINTIATALEECVGA